MTDLVSLGSVGTPLTAPQRAMWATQRRHRTSPLLNMAILTHLDGVVDIDRLIESFDAVVAQNRVLSHVVEDRAGGPVWVRPRESSPTTEVLHLDRVETASWAIERAAIAVDPRKRTFDSVAVVHADSTCSWYLDLHHLATDASSSALVFSLTAQEYAVRSGLEPAIDAMASPGAYFEWSAKAAGVESTRLDKSRDFWSSKNSVDPLGRLYDAASDLGSEPAATRHRVEAELVLPSYAASISEQMSWTTLMATTAAILVARVTQADAFTIGIPLHHRRTREAKALVGPLMEIAPVSLTIDRSMTVADTHAYVASEVMAALGNSHPGHTPAVEVDAVVNVIPHAQFGDFGGVSTTSEWIHSGAIEPSNLFRLQLTPYTADGLSLIFDLNDTVAPPDSSLAASHVSAVLKSVLSRPDIAVNDIPLVSVDEEASIEAWGEGDASSDPELLLPRLQTALAASDSIAIDDGAASLTGRALWLTATAMAEELFRAGVSPSSRVAIELGRGADAVVAMLATMFCGASYVPIDPTQPETRRHRLQRRAGVVLTIDSSNVGQYRGDATAPFEAAADRVPSAQDEAYLLFTSGSTGEPKGVPITHQGLADYVDFAVSEYFADVPLIVAPLFSALTFDLTVTTLFAPLAAGGTVAIVRPDGTDGLMELAARTDITWMKATPSHLELLCRFDPKSDMKTFVAGGEQFTAALARTIWSTFGSDARLVNEYGPTEAVVGCMIHEASPTDPGRSVAIGHPIDGVSLRIVDDSMNTMPIGAPGELLVCHRGVTSGYLDAEHDVGRFVELDGRRWYCTGDLVRLIDPDTAVYLGRIDEQMKVGGIRLEPSEIEAALLEHPHVEAAAVRLWSPQRGAAENHCLVCGLPSNVPAAEVDAEGICATCRSFDAVAEQTASYFGNLDQLSERLNDARRRRTGDFDVLHMLSGGKDSTFALHKLVELGFRPYVLTLDNGFISEGALDNARRSIDSLGIEGEIVTSDVMNDVFRTSLDRYSNVCHGCYKALYTFASQRAADLGIPVIMTGLSRGQLFETRLAPQQFEAGSFDPDAIDTAIVAARKSYHRVDDSVNRLLDTSVFDDDEFFNQVEFVDFYRYADIPLSEMFEFLGRSTPWVRPSDTGRSTNCLVNAAGIYTHQLEQGYHNYAIPYAWDVRLGHKTRIEAMEELDDELDITDVSRMLSEIGYEPQVRKTLTAWVVTRGEETTAGELRRFVSDRLQAAAVPSAYVDVDVLPMTTNGKLDIDALPAPSRVVRSSALHVAPSSPAERSIAAVYERILQVEPVSADDDFFDLGGDSLAALDLASILREELSPSLSDEMVFAFTSPRALADVVDVDVADASSEPAKLERRPDGIPPPLSSGESALLYEHLNDPTSAKYHVARHYLIPGPVDLTRLANSVQTVAERHVSFSWSFSIPRKPIALAKLVESDIADGAVSTGDFERLATSAQQRSFDLDEGPLLRLLARPLEDGSTAVCVALHHLSIDAGTFDVLWSQIDAEYLGLPTPVDVDGPDHGDVVTWQEANVSDADHTYWADLLAEPTSTIELGRRNASDGLAELSLSVGVDELAIGGATPFAVVMAAVAIAIRRRSAGSRIGIGVTASTKNHTAAEHLVAYDLNTLPIVVEVDSKSSTIDVVRRAAGALASALPHRTTPLSTMVAKRRDAGLEAPDISVVIAFERFAPAFLGGVEATHVVMWSGESIFDATFFAQVRDNKVDLSLEYSGQILDTDGAKLLLDDVNFILTSVVDSPHLIVESLELPSTVTHSTSSDLTEYVEHQPYRTTLVSLIDSAMPANRESVAACNGSDQLTWQDLETQSVAIGRALNHRGIGRGHMVAVDAVRDVSTVGLIVGILRSGAAYVPLDLSYPEAHISHVLHDANINVLLTARPEAITDQLSPHPRLQILGMGDLAEALLMTVDSDAEAHQIERDDPAYVIYTSGSSGNPKGVVVTHGNIAFATEARRHSYPSPPSVFLMVSSMSFDSSMVGLWWPLTSGGAVVLPDEDRRDDVIHFSELIGRHSASHTLMLPSLYDVLLDVATPDQLSSLETVLVAGEACPLGLIDRHFGLLPDTALVNEYGPTETTVWSHRAVLEPKGTDVPIGELASGAHARVVAPDGFDSPHGVPGELWIGGPGVTAGYLGLDDLTSAAFVIDAGRLMYRTGDLVDVDQNGEYRFHGRIDDQVKIRGHRVELEAVEAALAENEHVHDAGVVLATRMMNGRSQGVLVAHVVGVNIDETSVIDALRVALPEHMVPGALVVTSELPRRPNGKLDRRALEQLGVPKRTSLAKSADSAASDFEVQAVEDALAAGWCSALGIDSVTRHDDFYDLGGDSIVAIRIAAAVRAVGLSFTPRDIFAHSTIADLAPRVVRLGGPVEPRRSGPMPLTAIQRWFFAHEFKNPNLWNQGVWLTLAEPIAASMLHEALHAVVRHHEALSSVFVGSGATAQQIVNNAPVLTPVLEADFEGRTAAESAANEAINIVSGPQVAASVLDERGSQSVFLTAHHLVVDAVTWSIIVEDLGSAISALTSGSKISLAERQTSAGAWVEHLISLPPVVDSRVATELRSGPSEGDTRTVSTMLNETETEELLAVGQPIDVSILAALNDAVRTSAGAQNAGLIDGNGNVVVTVERHGREAVSPLDLSLTVGWFTATAQLVLGPNQHDVSGALEQKRPEDLYDDRAILAGGELILTDVIRFNHLGTTSGALTTDGPVSEMSGPFGYIDAQNARTQRLGVLSRIVSGRLEISLDHAPEDLPADVVDGLTHRLHELLCSPGWFDVREQPVAQKFELAGLDSEQLDDLASLLDSLDN